MEEFEFRLPKFLTEKEAKVIRFYHTHLLRKEFQAYDKIWNTETEVTNTFLHTETYLGEYDLTFMPGIGRWGLTDDSLNLKLSRALRKVMIGQFGDSDKWDLIIFFNRAYAYVLHAVNNTQPELDYGSFSSLWMEDKMLKRDRAQCELICACMVHCILDYEKDSHLQPLLQEIEWRLQASKNGINMDTLKVFQEAVTAAANEQTEENTPSEEQPMADTPLEKEEEAAPTLSDDDIKAAIYTLQKEGYLDEKVRYLGVHKVLVNRGVCSSNLSDFCRYLQKLGFAEERTHGAGMKRKTNDIYEVVKKIPSSFRDQRLSEWLSSREEQLPKHQKITDTAKRCSELIPSRKG